MSPASRAPDAAGNAPAVWLASQTNSSACVTSSSARNATKPIPTRQYRLRYQTGLVDRINWCSANDSLSTSVLRVNQPGSPPRGLCAVGWERAARSTNHKDIQLMLKIGRLI